MRVVITGIGVITSIGIGSIEFWKNLVLGKSGISEVTGFDSSIFLRKYRGGEIKNFNPRQFMSDESAAKMGRASQLAVAAAKLALEDARLKINNFEEAGVSLGSNGDVSEFERVITAWEEKGEEAIDNSAFARFPAGLISSNVAKEFGLEGPNVVIPVACSAGNYSIGYAFDLIRSGRASKMIAGGAEAFHRHVFASFYRMGVMAPDVPRPFDKDRKGMMVGEGAGILILEKLEDALARKANIYAEVLGYGVSCDGLNTMSPDPGGRGIALAMLRAMQNSKVKPDEVDYISAHGTATLSNDASETAAIKKVFGKNPKALVSSIKSMLGHTFSAASAIEAAVCALAVKHNIAPPTMNIRKVDPMVTFDVVANQGRLVILNVAMNNALAMGGINSSLIIKKYKG